MPCDLSSPIINLHGLGMNNVHCDTSVFFTAVFLSFYLEAVQFGNNRNKNTTSTQCQVSVSHLWKPQPPITRILLSKTTAAAAKRAVGTPESSCQTCDMAAMNCKLWMARNQNLLQISTNSPCLIHANSSTVKQEARPSLGGPKVDHGVTCWEPSSRHSVDG